MLFWLFVCERRGGRDGRRMEGEVMMVKAFANERLVWWYLGDKNAMGVFIWATDSAINSRVRGVPIVELMNGNVSTVGDAVGVGQTS